MTQLKGRPKTKGYVTEGDVGSTIMDPETGCGQNETSNWYIMLILKLYWSNFEILAAAVRPPAWD